MFAAHYLWERGGARSVGWVLGRDTLATGFIGRTNTRGRTHCRGRQVLRVLQVVPQYPQPNSMCPIPDCGCEVSEIRRNDMYCSMFCGKQVKVFIC